ncbi:polysaccharide deacetylase family protein [Rheinheimera maricola]|uniref:Polysaccharide deacetylase family protein n=1 Tax=Rheinheimera maricola TaxID=2793282 RepID=A0ABS7X862_9GAMM|nr:polysaccharide deacetylase family protein [Rheinheimera maricola]MBZ9611733.1 polysaccharide deacetylase family protein [Rheinheimera maricola]
MMHKLLQQAGKLFGRNKLSILIYHQVLTEYDPMRPSEPTAEIFDWHMRLLRRYFTPLSLDDALQHLQQNTLPANAVCVTFDDGYLNNLTIAQPVLARYQIPATVYVATGFSHGTNMWNDRLIYLFADKKRQQLSLGDEQVKIANDIDRREKAQQWLKKLKYLPIADRLAKIDGFYQQNNAKEQAPLMMTPDQIKQLSDSGVTIGAHTVNHPILKVLSETQQLEEISQSRQQLETWLGCEIKHFAYPNGVAGRDFDDTTTALVKQTDFQTAVVTNSGVSSAGTSPYKLKRFTPWDTTALKFHARLINNMRQAHD